MFRRDSLKESLSYPTQKIPGLLPEQQMLWTKSFGDRGVCVCVQCSVMSDSLRPEESARLLCSRDSPGKNTGVGSHSTSPGDLPDSGIEPRSSALQADFSAGPPGKPRGTWAWSQASFIRLGPMYPCTPPHGASFYHSKNSDKM